jgi:long-chain acyl-CoA synthetase
MTLVDTLERNARTFPDDPAFVEVSRGRNQRKVITWRTLDDRTNRIARILVDRGVGRGDKVLHWMKNSITWFEGYFGILKTGAWAVPLNYRFTAADFRYCAEVVEPKAVILEEEFAETVHAVGEVGSVPRLVFGKGSAEGMENLEELVSGVSGAPISADLGRNDDCSLYFTSGTTGDPKPILHTHRSLEWLGVIGCTNFRISHKDNFIIITPLYHLGAFGWWLSNFLMGARATILTDFSPAHLLETVSTEKVTAVFLPVPWTQDILLALDRGELRKEDYDLTTWRVMHMGAQPIASSIVAHWKRYFPDMEYHTCYGQSEAGFSFHLDHTDTDKVGSVGRPAIGWDARIVDSHGIDVPVGETGELIVKGNAVMTEYYKNPGKTEETIRNGWVYTGDLARRDDEGFTYIVGRKRDVIISGGENIYPEEVEEALQAHPKIEDVGVIGLPDERLGEIAVAVIQVMADETMTVLECEEFCARALPRYKRPKRIIFDCVPRNATGKIEKTRLKEKHG